MKHTFLVSFIVLLSNCSDITGPDPKKCYGNYVQTQNDDGVERGDTAWWTFTEDGSVLSAVKIRITGSYPPQYMPIKHSRGNFSVSNDGNLTWLLYSRVTFNDIHHLDIYDSIIAPHLAKIGTMTIYDTVNNQIVPRPSNHGDSVYYMQLVLQGGGMDCSVSDAEEVLYLKAFYVRTFDPLDWNCTYCQPDKAEFHVKLWRSDTVYLEPVNGTMGPSFEGAMWSGKSLTDASHQAYNELDAGY